MAPPTPPPPRGILSQEISPIILGGAAWSHQINLDVYNRPVIPVLLSAFSRGILTIDTSPYYEPSEQILGAALAHADIKEQYGRSSYTLMTKVGRVSATQFDYSPEWVRRSVLRSLARFQTDYLDVVFCHDVEFVSDEEVLTAIGVLWGFVDEGKVRYVGVSGYPVEKLCRIAEMARQRFGRPLDVVQNWGQLTLQNTKLKTDGLKRLSMAGVSAVCASSPLNIGLLRAQGVPQGSLGNWHPAPPAMRAAAAEAATFVASKGDDLASVALRFAFRESARTEPQTPTLSTIIGPGSVEEVEGCAQAAMSVRKVTEASEDISGDLRDKPVIDEKKAQEDEELVQGARNILKEWLDFCFESPPRNWDIENKKMITEVDVAEAR